MGKIFKKIEHNKNNVKLNKVNSIIEMTSKITVLKPHDLKSMKKKFKSKISGIFEVPVSDLGPWKRTNIISVTKPKTLRGFYNKIVRVQDEFDKRGDEVNSIVLYFQPTLIRNRNKIAYTTVGVDALLDFDDFRERIEDQQTGKIAGSDTYSEDDYNLMMNVFNILSVSFQGNAVKYKSNYFKTIEEDKGVHGLCGYYALKKIGVDITEEEYKEQKLYLWDNLNIFIDSKSLDIAVIGNVIKYNSGFNMKNIKDRTHIKTTDNKNMVLYLHKLTVDDLDLCFLAGDKHCKNYLFYDAHKLHYSFIQKEDLLKEIYVSVKKYLYKYDEKKDSYTQIETYSSLIKSWASNNMIKKTKYKLKYLFFDYETVVDFTYYNLCRAYALAFTVLDDTQLASLNNAEEIEDTDHIDKVYNDSHFYLGFDCTQYLYDYISSPENKDTIFKFVSFNGAAFDNFILYNDLKNINPDCVGSPFYNKSLLMNFKMFGVHHCFDLHKHLTGSLKYNCEQFKIELCIKRDFDHNEAQQLYNNGLLIETLSNDLKIINEWDKIKLQQNIISNDSLLKKHIPLMGVEGLENTHDIKEYNIYDVLSLAVLFQKYRTSIKRISGVDGEDLDYRTCYPSVDVTEKCTIGSYTYEVFQIYWKREKIELGTFYVPIKTKTDHEKRERFMSYFDDLKKYNSGGRVQLFNGIQKILEECVSMDVCSLYPYVMAIMQVYYPIGDPIETDKVMRENIGFYYCDIDQSILKINKIPLIVCERGGKTNNWTTDIILKDYLISTVTIKLLKKYKCKVVIKHGFYFENHIKSCDMFQPILHLMKGKNEQDDLKRAMGGIEKKMKNLDEHSREYKKLLKDYEAIPYNKALREAIKLISNASSGKMVEGLHIEQIKEMTNYEALKYKNVRKNFIVRDIQNNNLLVSYDKENEECMRASRPVHLGILIYDYSKVHMYEHLYSKIPLEKQQYTDTDSVKFLKSAFDDWLPYAQNTIVSHWPEVEKYDPRYKTHTLYSPDSKVYGSLENEYTELKGCVNTHYYLQPKAYLACSKEASKMSFKGVSNSDVIVYVNDKNKEYVKTKDGSIYLEGLNESDLSNTYNIAYKLYVEDEYDNRKYLFEILYNNGEGGTIKLLSQVFQRCVKQQGFRNTVKIFCRFKKITVKKV